MRRSGCRSRHLRWWQRELEALPDVKVEQIPYKMYMWDGRALKTHSDDEQKTQGNIIIYTFKCMSSKSPEHALVATCLMLGGPLSATMTMVLSSTPQ